MSKSRQAKRKPPPYETAVSQLRGHYLLGPVARGLHFNPIARYGCELPRAVYCRIEGLTTVMLNDALRADEATWLGVLSLATLVLAVGGPQRLPVQAPISGLAAQLAALHWWRTIRLGELPERFALPPEILQWGRLPLAEIAARLRDEPEEVVLDGAWTLTGSSQEPLMQPAPRDRRSHASQYHQPPDHEQVFAQALVDNAKRALQALQDANLAIRTGSNPDSAAARARRWLIAHYPLLGSLLTRFELVEDIVVCHRLDIAIAAIHVGTGEIYLNPAGNLSFESAKFVIAHEVLHAGLEHVLNDLHCIGQMVEHQKGKGEKVQTGQGLG